MALTLAHAGGRKVGMAQWLRRARATGSLAFARVAQSRHEPLPARNTEPELLSEGDGRDVLPQ